MHSQQEGGNGASFGQLLLGNQPDCGEVMQVHVAVVLLKLQDPGDSRGWGGGCSGQGESCFCLRLLLCPRV